MNRGEAETSAYPLDTTTPGDRGRRTTAEPTSVAQAVAMRDRSADRACHAAADRREASQQPARIVGQRPELIARAREPLAGLEYGLREHLRLGVLEAGSLDVLRE